jgi:hypothetical protein
MSIFWEVIISVILSKKLCPISVSEIELFHCTDAKLLIKRYYVFFLISVFTVQVTKLFLLVTAIVGKLNSPAIAVRSRKRSTNTRCCV